MRFTASSSNGSTYLHNCSYFTSCLYRNQVLPAHHAHALPLHEGDFIGQVIIQSPPHSSSSTPSLARYPSRSLTNNPRLSPILHDHTLPNTSTSTHNIPNPLTSPATPLTINEHEERRADVNPWVCVILLVVTVGFTGATAEFVSPLHKPQVSMTLS